VDSFNCEWINGLDDEVGRFRSLYGFLRACPDTFYVKIPNAQKWPIAIFSLEDALS